ncbi:MAG: B-box zinc finger protein [Myxococcales bacterium]|nr:B-box zinc finger protein [Myxococcales bacterium]
MGDDHRGDEMPPEGAMCAEHPDDAALFVCERCGSYCCGRCFQPVHNRCSACLLRDPASAAPQVPWESEQGSALGRYFRTLGAAFSPMRTAPAFGRNDSDRARSFLMLSALPLACLAGVIPHTRTLLFSGYFQVSLVGQPSSEQIVLDVLRAMLVQVVLSGSELLILLLPFVSLVRAYAGPERRHAAVRVLFYRLWLLPGTMALSYIGVWALAAPDPEAPIGAATALILTARMVLPVFLVIAMASTARAACGLGRLMSMVVVMVPLTLLLFAQPVVQIGIEQLLPALSPEAMEAARPRS